MNLYAIEVMVRGTLCVKARNLGKARYVLDRLSTKTVDATDDKWFSSAPFDARPKVSFANEFLVVSAIPNSPVVQVSDDAMRVANEPFYEGRTWRAISNADEKIDVQWPVFSLSVDLTGTVLARAESVEEASIAVNALSDFTVEERRRSNKAVTSLVPLRKNLEASIFLADRLYLVGPSDGQKLGQVWPDEPYPAANEIPITLSDEFHYLSE